MSEEIRHLCQGLRGGVYPRCRISPAAAIRLTISLSLLLVATYWILKKTVQLITWTVKIEQFPRMGVKPILGKKHQSKHLLSFLENDFFINYGFRRTPSNSWSSNSQSESSETCKTEMSPVVSKTTARTCSNLSTLASRNFAIN